MTKEWVLGISDNPPKRWAHETFDEQITVTSSHSFHELVAKICETALKKRRGEDDSGIDDHLWNLKINSLEQHSKSRIEALFESDDDDDDDDSDGEDGDASETKYRGTILIAPAEHIRAGVYRDDPEPYELIRSCEKLSTAILPPSGYVMHFTYDFGTTSNLYMKVLNVRPAGAQQLLSYFERALGPGKSEQDRDLNAVPAYHLPKEQQIDAYYPNFSKAFLGHYVPLQTNYQHDHERPQVAIGSATLGLSSRICSEKDTTFCTMENTNCSSDLMYSAMPFSDMNEFLIVAEQAWTPRSPENDPDHLDRYRYSWVSRHVFPSSAEADEVYNRVLEDSQSEYAQLGPKQLFFRLKADESEKKLGDFDFAKVFPKTHAQFQCGKFRWIKYKDNVLRVLVGRGTGHDHRGFDGNRQVLRAWKREFASLHELLCAVEASWVYNNKDLGADTVISEFDLDLGPSHPGPKEPDLLGKKEDAVVVAKCSDAKKLVTTLAIAEEANGKPVLYSGHDDGTLSKWCLEENKQLWTKHIFPDGREDFPHFLTCGVHVSETAGVAGLVVRSNGSGHLIYTWSDAYEGYPEKEFQNREPSKVKCWRGKDGSYVKSYACDVGLAEEGTPAHPSIAAVVFCRLLIENQWVDSMIVGLHCICGGALQWAADYSDYDIEEAQEIGQGNILPFYEHSNGRAMETWRGHGGIVQAMAVMPDQYLLSYSMRPGHGLPDAMILWSLEDPGVPLCRHDLWDPSRSLYKQNLTRLYSVAGISVSGTDVLFATNYGDRIAVVSVEKDQHGDPVIELHGYGNIGNRYCEDSSYHGRMAMSGKHAVMANENFDVAWLFNIEGNAVNTKLDPREGNPRDFDDRYSDDDDDDEAPKYQYSGREIAIGKVEFPLFGGLAPRRKKRKSTMNSLARTRNETEDSSESEDFEGVLWTIDKESDGLGNGGPIALAMSGKWLVAGFSNGSIVRAPYLPSQFQAVASGSTGISSCSSLPSDEWHSPVLESEQEEDDDEEDNGGRRDRGECSIQ